MLVLLAQRHFRTKGERTDTALAHAPLASTTIGRALDRGILPANRAVLPREIEAERTTTRSAICASDKGSTFADLSAPKTLVMRAAFASIFSEPDLTHVRAADGRLGSRVRSHLRWTTRMATPTTTRRATYDFCAQTATPSAQPRRARTEVAVENAADSGVSNMPPWLKGRAAPW